MGSNDEVLGLHKIFVVCVNLHEGDCDCFDHGWRWANSVWAELELHEQAAFSLSFISRKRTKK